MPDKVLKPQTYVSMRENKQKLIIRESLRGLPECVTAFTRAIEPSTTSLTRSEYIRDLKLFITFLISELPAFSGKSPIQFTNQDFDSITADDILSFNDYLTLYYRDGVDEITNGELGKLRKLSTLRSFFFFMYKNGRISRNVSQLIDLPKVHTKPIVRLEVDEMVKMLDLADSGDCFEGRQKKWHEHTRLRDLAMLTLFLGTGIRVSECVGIDIDDVDFSINGFLVTRKGGNQVILYFPDEVAEVLREYLAARREMTALPGHENALFLSMQRKRMTVRAVEIMVKKYAAIAAPLKKKISPHKLRSTFGTNLYHETGDIYLVADVLGHSDVNTTRKHYAAMSDDRRRMAAKSVKLREED